MPKSKNNKNFKDSIKESKENQNDENQKDVANIPSSKSKPDKNQNGASAKETEGNSNKGAKEGSVHAGSKFDSMSESIPCFSSRKISLSPTQGNNTRRQAVYLGNNFLETIQNVSEYDQPIPTIGMDKKVQISDFMNWKKVLKLSEYRKYPILSTSFAEPDELVHRLSRANLDYLERNPINNPLLNHVETRSIPINISGFLPNSQTRLISSYRETDLGDWETQNYQSNTNNRQLKAYAAKGVRLTSVEDRNADTQNTISTIDQYLSNSPAKTQYSLDNIQINVNVHNDSAFAGDISTQNYMASIKKMRNKLNEVNYDPKSNDTYRDLVNDFEFLYTHMSNNSTFGTFLYILADCLNSAIDRIPMFFKKLGYIDDTARMIYNARTVDRNKFKIATTRLNDLLKWFPINKKVVEKYKALSRVHKLTGEDLYSDVTIWSSNSFIIETPLEAVTRQVLNVRPNASNSGFQIVHRNYLNDFLSAVRARFLPTNVVIGNLGNASRPLYSNKNEKDSNVISLNPSRINAYMMDIILFLISDQGGAIVDSIIRDKRNSQKFESYLIDKGILDTDTFEYRSIHFNGFYNKIELKEDVTDKPNLFTKDFFMIGDTSHRSNVPILNKTSDIEQFRHNYIIDSALDQADAQIFLKAIVIDENRPNFNSVGSIVMNGTGGKTSIDANLESIVYSDSIILPFIDRPIWTGINSSFVTSGFELTFNKGLNQVINFIPSIFEISVQVNNRLLQMNMQNNVGLVYNTSGSGKSTRIAYCSDTMASLVGNTTGNYLLSVIDLFGTWKVDPKYITTNKSQTHTIGAIHVPRLLRFAQYQAKWTWGAFGTSYLSSYLFGDLKPMSDSDINLDYQPGELTDGNAEM